MNTIPTSIRLHFSASEADDRLLHERLLRPQQAAKRFAYKRLAADEDTKAVWQRMREIFPRLTGRNLNDAILGASAVIESQREALPRQIQALTRRCERSTQKLEREKSRLAGPRPERVRALEHRLADLTERLAELQAHVDAGTVPAAKFGGRPLWRKLSQPAPQTQTAWREKRTREFLSVGARNQKGNAHCRLSFGADGWLQLMVRVPLGQVLRGGKPTTLGRWLTFTIENSQAYDDLLRSAVKDGDQRKAAYTVRLLRLSPGQYRAYVTVDEPVAQREYTEREALPTWCERLAGIDLNLAHVALALTDRQGQFRGWQVFKFPNLGELPRAKSTWQIGNLARDILAWATAHKVQALVLEDLNIDHEGGSVAFNRRTVPFSYRQLAEALTRTALRCGLAVKRVNPAYTSWIGQLKYARPYGLSVHVAAAYVIARRGLNFEERLPASLIRKFPTLAADLRTEIADLEQKAKGSRKGDEIRKTLAKRREWLRRLEHWKDNSPESGRPWLLWATLKAITITSATRAGLCALPAKTTEGRKDPACRTRSADNIRLAVVPG